MRNRKSIMKTLLVAFGFLAAAAVIGTPAQALVAGAALRSSGNTNAIAHLHAPHLGTHCLYDSNAAMALNQRHARHR